MAQIDKKPRVPKYVKKLLARDENGLVKIDLGGGSNPQPGFINIDYRKLKTVDIVQDLEQAPWPLPECCATLIVAGHLVEHINPAKGGFIKFMDECWRILKYGGQMMITTPYAGSRGYWTDPTHCNPCTIETWAYFDPMHPLKAYSIYKPKPWAITKGFYRMDGNMEVLLTKRRIDKSYGISEVNNGK